MAAPTGHKIPNESKALRCPTDADRGVEDIHDYSRMSNPSHLDFQKKTAAPMGLGSGGECFEGHSNPTRKSYNHPDRVAIRKIRDAKERVLRVIVAFNALEADEQHLVAERLAEIMAAGEPGVAFPSARSAANEWAAWASPDELRAYIAASFARLPRHERKPALKALGGVA